MPAAAPRVTVLMPVYNGERFLRPAMESVLGQTFGDFEFLIIDDGSTDGSFAIMESFRDPRIRRVRNETNLMLAGVLDKGFKLARGAYVARMDCDDVSLPERLALQAGFLDRRPEVGVVGAGFQLVDGQGRKLGAPTHYPEQHERIAWLMLFECPLAHPTVMLRRAEALAAGGYASEVIRGREKFSGEDYDLWRRMAKSTRLANLDQTLLLLRKHGGNVSQVHQEEHEHNAVAIRRLWMMDILGAAPPAETLLALWRRQFPTEEIALQAADTVERLCLAQAGVADARTRAWIRRDAARRLFAIFRRAWKDSRSLGILAGALRLDPLVLARAFLRSLVRAVRRLCAGFGAGRLA